MSCKEDNAAQPETAHRYFRKAWPVSTFVAALALVIFQGVIAKILQEEVTLPNELLYLMGKFTVMVDAASQ